MVQKLALESGKYYSQFESSVVLDGTKTRTRSKVSYISFESSVVLDGTKTTSVTI